MKLVPVLAISAAASLFATASFSQSAFDGSIEFQYIYAPDDDFEYQTQVDGSLVYSISPKFKVQFDIGNTFYEDNVEGDTSYGLHAIYAPSDMLNIGVFYALEYEDVESAGVEIAYSRGGIDIEAYYSWYDISYIYVYSTVGIEAGYTFAPIGSMPGGINIYAGIASHLDDVGALSFANYYGGIKANVWNNLDVDIRAASMDEGQYSYYSIGLSYNFGNGAVFTPRDFSSLFPGY